MADGLRDRVQVVAGVLRDALGRVLIAQRPPGKHMAGAWEFPGGKIRPAETPESALARELAEELGIALVRSTPLITLAHDYPDKRVALEFYVVHSWRGEPRGAEGQRLLWELPGRLLATGLLAADAPVAALLSRS